MKKKGQDWSMTLVGQLILGLAFLGIGLFIVKELSAATNPGFDKQSCKTSVVYNSKFRVPYLEAENFPVDCPTRFVSVGTEEIVWDIRGKETKTKIKCGNLDAEKEKECWVARTNKVVANLIFDCWDQFAAGQVPVFSRYTEDRQCIICSRIEFTDAVKGRFQSVGSQPLGFFYDIPDPEDEEGKGAKLAPLNEYMKTHAPFGHDISYFQFTMDKTDAYSLPYYDYTLTEPKAVVFVALNQNQAKNVANLAWEKVRSLFVSREGNKKTEYEYVNTLEFVPYDQVINQCDVLV